MLETTPQAQSEFLMSQSWTWKLNRTICSDPSAGVALIAELREHLEESNWSDKDIFAIHMAMEEAVMNAIKHGNLRDPKKKVKISIGTNTDSFWARIEDEGSGFDPDDVPDPTLQENIDKSSGRGVLLMRTYMDSVDYYEMGNVVELHKQKTAKA